MRQSTEVWNEFSEYLRNFIKSKVKPEDVDDILQDVFVKIHSHLNDLTDETKIESWIFQIARNTIYDYYKKPAVYTDDKIELSEEPVDTHNPIDCLKPMIKNLPKKYREALELSEIKGLKQQQVANELGISLSGAKSRVQRGREMLKQGFMSCCDYKMGEDGKLKGEHQDKENCSVCS